MDDLESKISNLLSSPDGMDQIMKVARALSNSSPSDEAVQEEVSSPPPPTEDTPNFPFDPSLLSKLSKLTIEPQNDKKTALLNALKPYLSKSRQEKLDRALNLMNMTRIAKVALSEYGGGEENV